MLFLEPDQSKLPKSQDKLHAASGLRLLSVHVHATSSLFFLYFIKSFANIHYITTHDNLFRLENILLSDTYQEETEVKENISIIYKPEKSHLKNKNPTHKFAHKNY